VSACIALSTKRVVSVALCALTIALASSASVAWGVWFTDIVAFGDSLTDIGNNGHASNGPLWVEDLASTMGLPAVVKASSGGHDYAVGGGRITGGGVPDLGQQVSTYVSQVGVGNANPMALYIVWAGSNDFLVKNLGVTIADAQGWALAVANDVGTLYAAGARDFLVPNLPPLGNIPLAAGYTAQQKAAFNQLVQYYNGVLAFDLASLKAAHPDMTYWTLDANALMSSMIASPSTYGFANVTDPWLANPTADPDTYLFYDGMHPTARGHQLLAEMAIGVVPEPSCFVLLGIAAGALAAAGIVRRVRR
jgi:phospholipase/lecithinase/hemolysin